MRHRFVLLLCAWLLAAGPLFRAQADQWDPPAGYYSGATGSGAALKSQLVTIMSTNQVMRTYGDLRYSSALQDADPNRPGNILLVYSAAAGAPPGTERMSVPAAWDPQNLPWNREHLWPQARQPGSVNNDTTGSLGDPHALRPADPDINGYRANKPFGFETTTGAHGDSTGGYYYPGDYDRGDVARALFYDDTRYGSLGLSLTDSFPTNNQMGDLSSLVAWNYLDVPDEFERRRNHMIYSEQLNPSYYTRNRNAYVDNPEYVWSVYMGDVNNSQLSLQGGTLNAANGASALTVDLGRRLVGAATPGTQTVTLNRSGLNGKLDGTYFRVTPAGDATSSIAGKFNALPVNVAVSKSFQVGLTSSTNTPGLKTGTVTIDNLDVSQGSAAGRGAKDANDVVTVSMSVLSHANASFNGLTDQNSLTLDFGTVAFGTMAPTIDFNIFNLAATPDFTAGLDLDSIVPGIGDFTAFSTDLSLFSGESTLTAGASNTFYASMSTATRGAFSASYTLNFSDENLPGAIDLGSLSLLLTGVVEAGAPTGDFNQDGAAGGDDFLAWQRGFGVTTGAALSDGDGDYNGAVDGADLAVWQSQLGSALPAAAVVPEPAAIRSALLASIGLLVVRPRRRSF